MNAFKKGTPLVDDLLATLERDGIVSLPGLFDAEALARMQRDFTARVQHVSFNGMIGYTTKDPYRRFVDDLCGISRDFIDTSTHPIVDEIVRRYISHEAIITEAKGWRSVPTQDDFHGWHNDAWYHPDLDEVPRQLKLAVYLSDVNSGEFQYLRGTHGQRRHKHFSVRELGDKLERRTSMRATAGTAFLFDVSGIHRQAIPILEERDVVFFVYNDPAVRIQELDERARRYRPLQLCASHLGALSPRQHALLGIGNGALERAAARPEETADAKLEQQRDIFDRAYHASIKTGRLTDKVRRRVDAVLSRLPGRAQRT